ncbi:hypothetical protein KY331_01680 [Candidatus Woesearchaeota archaeon]|nr:hypothetical protein [Candidatus Woesearchaeota archaeon]
MKLIKCFLAIIVLAIFSATAFAACNNGIIEGNEECDDGGDNSDTRPDACRTDCVWYHCGDGVTDTGEECDEGERPLYSANDDRIPNECREDCRLPWCGDGVVDYAYGEECDDALTPGCNNCLECYTPEDNLHISNDVELCPGAYTIRDEGEEGVIIVDGNGIMLNCNGAQLIGTDAELPQQQTQVGQQVQQIGHDDDDDDGGQGFVAQVFGFIAGLFGGGGATGDVTGHNSYTPKVGTGIYITGDNVLLIGCDVTNYRHGVKLSSSASGSVLVNNRLCGNSNDVKDESQENFGVANLCDYPVNWQENGINKCTYECDGSLNEGAECATAECPDCPECPSCENETEEQPPQPSEPAPAEEPKEDEDCIKRYVNVGYTEYQAKMICAGEMKIDECLKKYIDEGYDKEEAKKMCEETTTEEPTKGTTGAAPTEEEECIKKYVAAGYSEDEAVGICSGKIQLDDCIKKYIESGYSKEEAIKNCGGATSPFIRG